MWVTYTAAALKPWYRQFCKRPCFHDEYLPAFNQLFREARLPVVWSEADYGELVKIAGGKERAAVIQASAACPAPAREPSVPR